MSAPALQTGFQRGGPSVASALVAGGVLLAALLFLIPSAPTFARWSVAWALYLLIASLIIRTIGQGQPFGWANTVTLFRCVGVSALSGMAAEAAEATSVGRETYISVVSIAVVSLLSDAIDGWVARRTGSGSVFGARFDMETDALLILALAVLLAALGQVGGWIVLAGALRYVFVGAGLLWPPLSAPLPTSARRKLVCALQIGALIAMLVVSPLQATAIGIVSLAMLAGSFIVDIIWLVRHSPGGKP